MFLIQFLVYCNSLYETKLSDPCLYRSTRGVFSLWMLKVYIK